MTTLSRLDFYLLMMGRGVGREKGGGLGEGLEGVEESGLESVLIFHYTDRLGFTFQAGVAFCAFVCGNDEQKAEQQRPRITE